MYHAGYSHQGNSELKYRITQIVDTYRKVFSQEYHAFLAAQKPKRDALVKHAEVKGSDFIERQLGETPETLITILDQQLAPEELKWFRSKQGAKWFFTTYPEFSMAGGRI